MDFVERLRNLIFLQRLGKSIRPRLSDIVSEPLSREMIEAMTKLRKFG
jgi:hypothetical protein